MVAITLAEYTWWDAFDWSTYTISDIEVEILDYYIVTYYVGILLIDLQILFHIQRLKYYGSGKLDVCMRIEKKTNWKNLKTLKKRQRF